MSFDEAQFEHARQLAQEGRFEEAIPAFESLHLAAPEDANIAFMLGASYFKKGSIEDARRVWTALLQTHPGNDQAKAWLAKLPPPPAPASAWDMGGTSFDTAPPPAAKEPVLADSARKPRVQARKERDFGWVKWVIIAVAVLGIGGMGADMYMNPQSYPFLGAEKSAGTDPTPEGGPAGVVIPEEKVEALEPTLPGRWVFTWENDPATVTFSPDNKVSVEITREANMRIDFQGTWKIEGADILLENLASTNPAIGQIGTAKLLNAKIVRSQLVFNLNDATGPEISAIKQ